MKSILIVEDDYAVKGLISDVLGSKYLVLEAVTCLEAKKCLADNHIDCAIIDYVLPDGKGFEILDTIKQIKPKPHIMMMSAYGSEDLIIKAFRLGVTDYLRKPVSLKYLMSKLSEILEGKKTEEYLESEKNSNMHAMDYARVFIENNYMEDLTRDQLAEKMHMAIQQLSRAFNNHFGMSVKSYINSVRLKKAIELLDREPGASIACIAGAVGYGNLTHFERVFKKTYGISPGEYRRRQLISSFEMQLSLDLL